MKIFLWVFASLASLFMLILNVFIGIFVGIVIFLIVGLNLKKQQKLETWLKGAIEKDPLIQLNGFTHVTVGLYSILLVSDQIVRVIVFNTQVNMNKKNYSIEELYPNYPRVGADTLLNGNNVYYLDIPLSEIELVKPVTIGEVSKGLLFPNRTFGIRVQTKEGVIHDIDTALSNLFASEIENKRKLVVNKS